MSEALINPQVLEWAIQRGRLELVELAKRTSVTAEKIGFWRQGEARPTFKQAQDLARALRIPFGFLFLSVPPRETFPIPDLRTIGDHEVHWTSLELRDVLADALRKQDWFREYRLEQGFETLPFVGRFNQNDTAAQIASDLTMTLGLTLTDRNQVKYWEEFLTRLIYKAEAVGVFVMRNSMVGNNRYRALDVKEFRGFAICDSIAPLVFINSADSKAAQIFTLVHELVHLWIGESGISDLSLKLPSSVSRNRTERLCNATAAEVLVPAKTLRERWKSKESLNQNAEQLAGFFRVSTVMIARRAYDLGFVGQQEYADFYEQQAELWTKQPRSEAHPIDYYKVLVPMRNGKGFTSAVVQSVLERRLLSRDAGMLLGISPSKLVTLAQKLGIG